MATKSTRPAQWKTNLAGEGDMNKIVQQLQKVFVKVLKKI
jgi:hypothetical protein